MTEKEEKCTLKSVKVTDSETLALAFGRIGLKDNLARGIYDYVCETRNGEKLKIDFYELMETKSGYSALLVEFGDKNGLIVTRMALDERKTVLVDQKKEKVIGKLTSVIVDKDGKLALFDEQKRGVLLNLRSVIK